MPPRRRRTHPDPDAGVGPAEPEQPGTRLLDHDDLGVPFIHTQRVQRDLEPHADLRREILKRSVQAAIDDPRPPISQDFEEDMRKRRDRPRAEPALWIKGEYGP